MSIVTLDKVDLKNEAQVAVCPPTSVTTKPGVERVLLPS